MDAAKAKNHFESSAPKIMGALMQDLGINEIQAAAILGNLGVESLGLTTLREIGQKPGYGGYGWAQWTGVRRADFLSWCKAKGLDWQEEEANYGFLVYELKGPESAALRGLKKCKTLDNATVKFERTYERAGVKAHPERVRWARLALGAWQDAHCTN